MRKLLLLIPVILLSVFVFGQKQRKGLMDVKLISNSGDTILVKSKESYYNEKSFNSFGYYNKDGSRGRAHADHYVKIIFDNKYLESVKLMSTSGRCKKQIFLERIIDGPMIMYSFHYVKEMVYTSKCIDEIYIRKAGEDCAYPIYKKLCSHEILTMISQPKNKKEMLQLFSDAPEILNKIESGYYLRSDYERIVREYNRLKSK